MTVVHAADLDRFRITPDPNRIHFNAGFRTAAEKVLLAVRQRGGVTLLYGEPGIGKTTLLSMLRREMQKLHVPVSFVSFARVPFDSFLKLCLEDFGLPVGRDFHANLDGLRRLFASRTEGGVPAIIIIDDAQYCSEDLLAGITGLVGGGSAERAGVHIVLSGEAILRDHTLPSALDERVVDRIELRRLSREEIEQYIACRLGAATDAPRALFAGEIIDRIAAYSRGVPRIINQVCGRALLLAQGGENAGVTLSIASQAIEDYDASKTTNEGQLTREIATLVENARRATPEPSKSAEAEPAALTPPASSETLAVPAEISKPVPARGEVVVPPAHLSQPTAASATAKANAVPAPPAPTSAPTKSDTAMEPLPASADAADIPHNGQKIPRFSGFVPRRRMPIRTVAGDFTEHRWGAAPHRKAHLRARLAVALLLIAVTLVGAVYVSATHWPDFLLGAQAKLNLMLESGSDFLRTMIAQVKERIVALRYLGNRG